MKDNGFILLNEETGEVIKVDKLLVVGEGKFKDKEEHFKVFVTFLPELLDKRISGKAVRLFLCLLKYLDFNNLTIRIIPKYVREELGISKDTFYRWLKTLINAGILKKIDTYTYQLRAYTVIKGNMKKALENHLNDLKKEYWEDKEGEKGETQ